MRMQTPTHLHIHIFAYVIKKKPITESSCNGYISLGIIGVYTYLYIRDS